MESVHPGRRLPGSGVVHGERRYDHPQGRRRTPDIAIDRGPDLVLIEVCSGRLSLPTLIRGDVKHDLDNKLVGKACQLSDRIDDLGDGHAAIDDVDLTLVRRIWPIVIAPAGLLQNPALWDYIDEGLNGKLTQPRVQPLTVVDLAELECLAGLIEQGTDLIQVLEEKTSPVYARLDLRKMVWNDRASTHTRVLRSSCGARTRCGGQLEDCWASRRMSCGACRKNAQLLDRAGIRSATTSDGNPRAARTTMLLVDHGHARRLFIRP